MRADKIAGVVILAAIAGVLAIGMLTSRTVSATPAPTMDNGITRVEFYTDDVVCYVARNGMGGVGAMSCVRVKP